MSLIRVWTDIGNDKYVSLYARIIDRTGESFIIRFFTPTESSSGQSVYRYEKDTYEITDDSITHYLDVDDEADAGFKKIDDDEWIKIDEDEDYVPSDEDEDEEDENEEDDDEEDDYEEDEDI